jgi:SAM-dependent methyltransferase
MILQNYACMEKIYANVKEARMKRIQHNSIDRYSDLAGRTKFVCDWMSNDHIEDCDVLELGAGTGWYANYLLENYKFRSYKGIELDHTTKNVSEQNVKHPTVEFIEGSGLDLPFLDQTFDTCVTYDVIEHIPKGTEDKFFSEIYRVLRPGGMLYLSTPNHHILSTYTDPAFFIQKHRHYSEKKLERLVIEAGFKIAESFTRGGISEVLLLHNVYFSKWVLNRGPLFYKHHRTIVEKGYSRDKGFMNRFLIASK